MIEIAIEERDVTQGQRFHVEVQAGSGCAAQLQAELDALQDLLPPEVARQAKTVVTVLLVEGTRGAIGLVGHRIRVTIETRGATLRVSIQDTEADLITIPGLREQLSSVLYLMSDQWGTGVDEGGRFVWFETTVGDDARISAAGRAVPDRSVRK